AGAVPGLRLAEAYCHAGPSEDRQWTWSGHWLSHPRPVQQFLPGWRALLASRSTWPPSDLFDPNRALLEIGLERDRIRRVERDLVDELALIEPRDEHHAAWRDR